MDDASVVETLSPYPGVLAPPDVPPGTIEVPPGNELFLVGHFGRCMEALREAKLEEAVHEAVGQGKPFMGICVGMQMLFEASDEAPGVEGLGVVSGVVRHLTGTALRMPVAAICLRSSREQVAIKLCEAFGARQKFS